MYVCLSMYDVSPFHVSRVVKELLDGAAPLVALDPLLLPMLVSICPAAELPVVVSLLPPYLSAAKILQLVEAKKRITIDEVSSLACLCTTAVLNVKYGQPKF